MSFPVLLCIDVSCLVGNGGAGCFYKCDGLVGLHINETFCYAWRPDDFYICSAYADFKSEGQPWAVSRHEARTGVNFFDLPQVPNLHFTRAPTPPRLLAVPTRRTVNQLLWFPLFLSSNGLTEYHRLIRRFYCICTHYYVWNTFVIKVSGSIFVILINRKYGWGFASLWIML